MNWKSVSVRLTLWNVGALALALILFAATVAVLVRATMSAAVDRQLMRGFEQEARHWTLGPEMRDHHPFPPGAPGGPGGGQIPWEPGRIGPPDHDGPPDHHDQPPAEQNSDALFMPPHPRTFNLTGKMMGPPGSTGMPWDVDSFQESARGATVFSTVLDDGQPLRVLSSPLYVQGRLTGVIQVAYPVGEMERLLNDLVQILVLLIPFALAAAGVGGLFLTNRVLRPIRELRQLAREITAHDLSRRMELRGNDEFTELSRTFNGMIAGLESSFEQQRRFVADASHELRTPLATVIGSTSLALSSDRSLGEYRQALEVAGTAAGRMNRIVDDLLLLARSDSHQIELEMQPTPVAEILLYARDALHGSQSPPIYLEVPDRSLVVEGDVEYLVRVFVNLLNNAARHTPPTGRISLDARAEGDAVVARVSDTGEGISAEHLGRLGERFYRVDRARTRRAGGTGLGLAICKSILAAHRGTLTIESTLGQGTTVTVRLPRCHQRAD